jgi:hypothetical protein
MMVCIHPIGKKYLENIMLEAATGKINRGKIEQIFFT